MKQENKTSKFKYVTPTVDKTELENKDTVMTSGVVTQDTMTAWVQDVGSPWSWKV